VSLSLPPCGRGQGGRVEPRRCSIDSHALRARARIDDRWATPHAFPLETAARTPPGKAVAGTTIVDAARNRQPIGPILGRHVMVGIRAARKKTPGRACSTIPNPVKDWLRKDECGRRAAPAPVSVTARESDTGRARMAASEGAAFAGPWPGKGRRGRARAAVSLTPRSLPPRDEGVAGLPGRHRDGSLPSPAKGRDGLGRPTAGRRSPPAPAPAPAAARPSRRLTGRESRR
jgi:hypothetical protein